MTFDDADDNLKRRCQGNFGNHICKKDVETNTDFLSGILGLIHWKRSTLKNKTGHRNKDFLKREFSWPNSFQGKSLKKCFEGLTCYSHVNTMYPFESSKQHSLLGGRAGLGACRRLIQLTIHRTHVWVFEIMRSSDDSGDSTRKLHMQCL